MAMIVLGVFSFSMNAFAYGFLSLQSNAAIEQFREKHRIKEIVSEEEHGFIWAVILPKNDGVEINEIKEEIEGHIYKITEITITNPQGWTKVIWGSAAKFHPYDVPRLKFMYMPDN
jgi:hypothetical protein